MSQVVKYRQRICDSTIGDCFRACMATLLQLPPEVLPNDFTPGWHSNWQHYLGQFGLALSPQNHSKQPIWLGPPWIAAVKSLNFEGGTHAILMHRGGVVLFDPSPKKRYKIGQRLSSDVVLFGQHLIVVDALELHLLDEYRNLVCKPAATKT